MGDIHKLKNQRAKAKGSITRVATFINQNKDELTVDVNEFVTREIYLKQAIETYTKIQDQIEDIDEEEEYDRVEMEDKYLSILAKFKTAIRAYYAADKFTIISTA